MCERTHAITLPAVMEHHWRDRTIVLAAVATATLFAGTPAANLLVAGTCIVSAKTGTTVETFSNQDY